MKYLHFATALLLTGLAGCATPNRTDRYLLQEHNVPPALYARMTHKEALALTDIIELSREHLAPGFIVHYLSSTYAVYRLDTQDVTRLRQAKVSQEVIDYLQATPSMYGPRYYPYGPYYYGDYPYGYGYGYGYGGPGPVIVVAPYHRHYWW